MNVELQCDKFVTEMCKNRRFTARMGGMRNAQAAEILNRWCASGKALMVNFIALGAIISPF